MNRWRLGMAVPLFFLISSVLPPSLVGQPVAADPGVREALHLLDLWMDAQVAYGEIPGATAAVVHDQELMWAKGYGWGWAYGSLMGWA